MFTFLDGGGFNSATGGQHLSIAGGSVLGMPLTVDAQQSSTDGSDFYFFVMERDATGLLYGSYLGDPIAAEHTDGGTSRFDPEGVVYQLFAPCGTGSFPTTLAFGPVNPASELQQEQLNLNLIFRSRSLQQFLQTLPCVPILILLILVRRTYPQHFWDFGDGLGTSTAANPTHTYANVGQYTVMYVAIDPSSCNVSDTAYFNVN